MKESNEISPGKEGDLAAEESLFLLGRIPLGVITQSRVVEGLTFAQFCIAGTLVMLRTAFASQCNPAG